jgi:DNA-binding response OmpR family regulator
VRGEVLPLPRRERRILEYLVSNKGRRVTKTQIFNSVYGLFGEDIDENVVESHISKLRKRLRHKLGHDPIDSQRYLGYRLIYD